MPIVYIRVRHCSRPHRLIVYNTSTYSTVILQLPLRIKDVSEIKKACVRQVSVVIVFYWRHKIPCYCIQVCTTGKKRPQHVDTHHCSFPAYNTDNEHTRIPPPHIFILISPMSYQFIIGQTDVNYQQLLTAKNLAQQLLNYQQPLTLKNLAQQFLNYY